KECFGKGQWDAEQREVKLKYARYITLMTERFNSVSRWIVTKIIQQKDIQQRAKLIQRFMQIAIELRKLNNFDGLNQLVAAFSSDGVFRLKKTWKLIPEEKAQFEKFQQLFAHPYNNLRVELDLSPPPW